MEPRFVLIDKVTKQVFEFTTDQIQAAFWRIEQPGDGAYFEVNNGSETSNTGDTLPEL